MRIKFLVSFPLNPLFLNLYTTLKAINQSVRGIKLILFGMAYNDSSGFPHLEELTEKRKIIELPGDVSSIKIVSPIP